ncbi:MAG: diacylglycerol kinase family lipid kinase [Kiritimatiellae bacterium]|nr:diacylglycerol kinase family lipid kinase [Kiritimatiellia bacterium]MDD4342619.1 diacylglycerol kinase family lipid kinase [Kiritimatiellia bacterium]
MSAEHARGSRRKCRVLINPKSGTKSAVASLRELIERGLTRAQAEVTTQFSHSVADGQQKARRAVQEEVDTIFVVGGDGMVNSIGSELIGTPTALGVIPTGSGNGFARHFGIPLDLPQAIEVLATAPRFAIDVGTANGHPFFVTCSMAWDAEIVRSFEAMPMRGIAPYVFAAAAELITFDPQPFDIEFDGHETVTFDYPAICTVANLTQYGGGAQIAPSARPDDGIMEMVMVRHRDLPHVLVNIRRLFNGTIDQLPQVFTRPFRRLVVTRPQAGPIQVDGELRESPAGVQIDLRPRGLTVRVPQT